MKRDGLGNWQPDKTARAPLPRDTRCAMPRPPLLPLLLLLLPALLPALAQDTDDSAINATVVDVSNGTSVILIASNDTLLDAANETLADGDHEPVVRKKLAFPPPLAPVPGIDLPLQAATPAPATAPCGTPRAAAPPPCRAQAPTTAAPRPRAAPPCPKPRAAPRRRPRPRPSPPPPPPPSPPPCAQPRANPSTAAPCAPATTPAPRPSAPKADNLETITSNFRLHFNFNRAPAGAAAVSAPADEQTEEQELEQEQEQEQVAPVAIEPRAARLPPAQARKPRVYVDAFVVRNGVPQKVDALDAQHLNAQRLPLEDEYLVYDYEELQQLPDDDYEDVQESRDRTKAVSDFSDAVDKFWEPKKRGKKKLPANDYRNVHFGDRGLADLIRRRDDDESHQSLKRERPKAKPKTSPPAEAEAEEEAESTTTTEDPKRPLRPRVLPPTEHNPGQIDTVTVRVPPIYKERRPKKLNRERPQHDEYLDHRDHYEERAARDRSTEHDEDADADTEGEDSAWTERTQRPARRKRRKQRRDKRAAREEPYTAGDYDYYGNKLSISDEEKFFRGLTVPPPTKYAEFARLEEGPETGYFLDDHERIREDPERVAEDERSGDRYRADSSERADDSGATDDKERSDEAREAESAEETGRADDSGRADERERTDRLGPNARVHETGFQNNYVRATNVQVDDPHPHVASVKKKTTKIGKA
ncbi:hypothetical protein RR46_14517 [Papilio xuthus]|uniref:Uncharacterized protein n=1 Tax=Papilio xuthus TaxID=66420 RepID=A0A194PDC7_PAPXU|nr:hypothetical protein RR46_14517 [Papilio xuthus]